MIFIVYILHLADVKLKITAKESAGSVWQSQGDVSNAEEQEEDDEEEQEGERDFTTWKPLSFPSTISWRWRIGMSPCPLGRRIRPAQPHFGLKKKEVNVNFIYSWHFESLWLKFQDWHKIVVKIRVTLWKLLVLVYYYYLFIL